MSTPEVKKSHRDDKDKKALKAKNSKAYKNVPDIHTIDEGTVGIISEKPETVQSSSKARYLTLPVYGPDEKDGASFRLPLPVEKNSMMPGSQSQGGCRQSLPEFLVVVTNTGFTVYHLKTKAVVLPKVRDIIKKATMLVVLKCDFAGRVSHVVDFGSDGYHFALEEESENGKFLSYFDGGESEPIEKNVSEDKGVISLSEADPYMLVDAVSCLLLGERFGLEDEDCGKFLNPPSDDVLSYYMQTVSLPRLPIKMKSIQTWKELALSFSKVNYAAKKRKKAASPVEDKSEAKKTKKAVPPVEDKPKTKKRKKADSPVEVTAQNEEVFSCKTLTNLGDLVLRLSEISAIMRYNVEDHFVSETKVQDFVRNNLKTPMTYGEDFIDWLKEKNKCKNLDPFEVYLFKHCTKGFEELKNVTSAIVPAEKTLQIQTTNDCTDIDLYKEESNGSLVVFEENDPFDEALVAHENGQNSDLDEYYPSEFINPVAIDYEIKNGVVKIDLVVWDF